MSLFNEWIRKCMNDDSNQEVVHSIIIEVVKTCNLALIKEVFEEHKIDMKKVYLGNDKKDQLCLAIGNHLDVFEYLISKGLKASNITRCAWKTPFGKENEMIEARFQICLKYNYEFSDYDEFILTRKLSYEQAYKKMRVIRHQKTKTEAMYRAILINDTDEVRKWYFDGADINIGMDACFKVAVEESHELEEGVESKALENLKFLVSKGAQFSTFDYNGNRLVFVSYHPDVIKFLESNNFYSTNWNWIKHYGTPEEKSSLLEFMNKQKIKY